MLAEGSSLRVHVAQFWIEDCYVIAVLWCWLDLHDLVTAMYRLLQEASGPWVQVLLRKKIDNRVTAERPIFFLLKYRAIGTGSAQAMLLSK